MLSVDARITASVDGIVVATNSNIPENSAITLESERSAENDTTTTAETAGMCGGLWIVSSRVHLFGRQIKVTTRKEKC